MKVVQGVENPNGIQLSRDERTLYLNNTRGEYLLAFDIQPDGTPTNRRNVGRYEGVTKTDTGADKKTLYIVGRGAAFKVQMLSQGFTGRVK